MALSALFNMFLQRVALVSNNAHRNELLDDKTLIKRLRKRITELQVRRCSGGDVALYTID